MLSVRPGSDDMKDAIRLLPSHLVLILVTVPFLLLTSPMLLLVRRVQGRRLMGIEALFTNSRSHGVPPGYEPGKPGWQRSVLWWTRNPMHDYTAYFIGIAGTRFTSSAVVGPVTVTLMSDIHADGWIVSFRRWGWLFLPFVSYSKRHRSRVRQFYWGWRPFGGFGVKNRVVHPK